MVLLHIHAKSREQANEIVDYLLEKSLILNAVLVDQAQLRKKDEDGNIVEEARILIMGKTKALLFNTIDQQMRDRYKEKMPVLYSVPIVSMDWEQANELVMETAKV